MKGGAGQKKMVGMRSNISRANTVNRLVQMNAGGVRNPGSRYSRRVERGECFAQIASTKAQPHQRLVKQGIRLNLPFK